MAPPPAVALALSDEHDPVWEAALAAPPCEELFSAEELASIESAIDDVREGRARTVGRAEVHAAIEERRRAGA